MEARSAGSEPRDQINPVAVAAMAEVGIDIIVAVAQLLWRALVALDLGRHRAVDYRVARCDVTAPLRSGVARSVDGHECPAYCQQS